MAQEGQGEIGKGKKRSMLQLWWSPAVRQWQCQRNTVVMLDCHLPPRPSTHQGRVLLDQHLLWDLDINTCHFTSPSKDLLGPA